MRWTSLFLIVTMCIALAPPPGIAADGKNPPDTSRIAVINLQKILREASATRTIRPQIDKLKESYQDKFKKHEQELRAANQDLQRQRSIITPEAYAARLKEFKERVTELQREVQSVQRMIDKAGSDALGKVHREFQEITTALAKERSIELILPRSGVLYADARHDISDEVLKRLNKQLPSVTVVLPENAPEAELDSLEQK